MLVVASVLAASCSDAVYEPLVPCADDQAVTVSVGSGTTPRFTWSPACGMASLLVTVEPADGSVAWVLYRAGSSGGNPLPSGVRYGQVPPGAVQPATAEPLSLGTTYRVSVHRWIGQAGGPGSLFEQGSATFRP